MQLHQHIQLPLAIDLNKLLQEDTIACSEGKLHTAWGKLHTAWENKTKFTIINDLYEIKYKLQAFINDF